MSSEVEAELTTKTPDVLYECEVAIRQFVAKGEYKRAWKVKSVSAAITDGDELIRCKDCHGKVRLHGRNVSHGPTPHAEHRSRSDSEYCRSGHYFRQAEDERAHQMSRFPVE